MPFTYEATSRPVCPWCGQAWDDDDPEPRSDDLEQCPRCERDVLLVREWHCTYYTGPAGRCSCCGIVRPLLADGSVSGHQRWDRQASAHVPCPGSTKPPRPPKESSP